MREEWLYRVVVVTGGYLVFRPAFQEFSRRSPAMGLRRNGRLALFIVVLLGLGFTWWARIHLGRLWSSSVTRKAVHRVVDTGPYGIVRHPIYTGIIAGQFRRPPRELGTRGPAGRR